MDERRAQVDGLEVFWREAPAVDGGSPAVYVHGVPTSSDDWLPFLERTGGLALDLPGFGRSDKPAHFPYGIDGYARFLESWLAHAGVDRYRLVVHDWGAVGLALAQRAPERLDRLVVVNAVPFLDGYRWHWIARNWRMPLIGELTMGTTFKWTLPILLKGSTAAGRAPADFVDRLWSSFDHGTQRAILKLYRSAPPDALAAAGERLGELTAPALVVWGDPDKYIPTGFAQRYADALGGPARVEVLPGAHHWPWIGRAETVDLIAGFLLERG